MQSFPTRVWLPASGEARAEAAEVTDATTTADVPPPRYRPSRSLRLGD